MDKLVYILWDSDRQRRSQRQQTLLTAVAPKLLQTGALKLSMYIVDQDADIRSPAPFYAGERMCAEVAIWVDDAGEHASFDEIFRKAGFRFTGYLVDESIYTEYGGNRHSGPRNWPDGQRSPGIVAVTLMERPKRLSRAEWIRRWHGTQSPVSEAMQPRARYVRNLVIRAVTPDAPSYEGIVEEAWPSTRHVTNYFLFYGAGRNPFKLVLNIIKMLRSVTSFLDLHRIRTTMTSEYIMKS
ncbi:hypothetical protein BZL29_6889 [Mycobacterium kansasii]|uniref:Uncharacterized protein n=1 Tax=Mycobacterium kansasii TaxID=1768 RepID=A0A1V3WM74_MYCKA|nr:hypothetical protein BZL29_6889 [Mycobacterium kansasii]